MSYILVYQHNNVIMSIKPVRCAHIYKDKDKRVNIMESSVKREEKF